MSKNAIIDVRDNVRSNIWKIATNNSSGKIWNSVYRHVDRPVTDAVNNVSIHVLTNLDYQQDTIKKLKLAYDKVNS